MILNSHEKICLQHKDDFCHNISSASFTYLQWATKRQSNHSEFVNRLQKFIATGLIMNKKIR